MKVILYQRLQLTKTTFTSVLGEREKFRLIHHRRVIEPVTTAIGSLCIR
ncbi:hypothetical protein AB0758_48045 [Tolypothrix bouteillei VB521301_2]